jgi:hypothetical protein
VHYLLTKQYVLVNNAFTTGSVGSLYNYDIDMTGKTVLLVKYPLNILWRNEHDSDISS